MEIIEYTCLFVALIVSVASKFQIGLHGTRPASFERFDGICPGQPTPFTYELQGVRIEGTHVVMNSTLTAKEDLTAEPSMEISIERCRSKENRDTCERFQEYKTNRYCTMIKTQTGIWGSYYKSFTPEWKCPMTKNVYRGINSKIDMAAMLMLLRGENWFWKANITLRDKRSHKPVVCTVAEDFTVSDDLKQFLKDLGNHYPKYENLVNFSCYTQACKLKLRHLSPV